MKIAVIGEGPNALETTLFFMAQECSVTLFGGNLPKETYFNRYAGINEDLETSVDGRKLLNIDNESLCVEDYKNNYFYPLWDNLAALGILRECQVNRITKAHLSATQKPEGKSRLSDLFRVSFEMNAEKMIQEQQKLNEMAFNNISPDSLSSLKRSIEMAEDYDLVILAKEVFSKHCPVGIGANPCLNENVFSKTPSFYESGFKELDSSVKSVALFGSLSGLSRSLMNLHDWLNKSATHRVLIVHPDRNISDHLGKTSSDKINDHIAKTLQELKDFFHHEEVRLEEELKKWNDLEDYERVKLTRPEMREAQITFFAGMNAISIDQLDESAQFFITLEPTKSPEQFEEFMGVKTIGVDAVINASRGLIQSDLVRGLDVSLQEVQDGEILFSQEPGFFQLASDDVYVTTQNISEKLKIIFSEIKKYFSKQGE